MAQNPKVIEFGKELARDIADDIFTRSQENLITAGAVDTSNLLLSSDGPQEIPKGYQIIYDAPYAEAINEGTDPHPISSRVLEGWVRRKINPGSEKKVKSIAFLIARKIRKRGTKPTFFMDAAIEAAKIKFNIK